MADPKSGKSPAKATILCVDDEENPLTLRSLVLQRAGYEVLTASSANQALEILSSSKVDLVLSDLLMPGKTGTELAREIKTNTPSLPVILISGVNEIPPEASYADMFLSKVEGPLAMCEKIASVLEANSN